ncbi:MAG: aminoacyl-tRNA hydrolase [Hyphomonadaceae bacterium]
MADFRLYAIINKEALRAAGGSRGKMMAQAGHAFLHAYWDAEQRFPERTQAYRSGRAKKIVLAVENEAALNEIAAREHKWGFTLVKDAALTVFKEPTVTAIGLGPIEKDEVPDWLSALPGLV